MLNKDFFKIIKNKDTKKLLEDNYNSNQEFKDYIKNLERTNYDFSNLNNLLDIVLEYIYSFNLCKDSKDNCKQNFKYYRKKIVCSSLGITSIELIRCVHLINDKNFILNSFKERSFPKEWITNNELKENLLEIKTPKQGTFFLNEKKSNSNLFDKNLYIYSKDEILRKKTAAWLAVSLVKKNKIKVSFMDERILVMKIKNTWSSPSTFLFNELSGIDLLVIDNFGMGNLTAGIRDDFIFPLLIKRFNDNKLTFIVSPFEIENIETVFRFSNSRMEIAKSVSFVQLIKNNTNNKTL